MEPGDGVWNETDGDVAFSMAVSLYEEDLEDGGMVGDPIADCCAVICTENYIIMVCGVCLCVASVLFVRVTLFVCLFVGVVALYG